MKKVVEKMKESGADESAIKKFQTGAQAYYTKQIAPNFKDYDFYVGESMDTDGMLVVLRNTTRAYADMNLGLFYLTIVRTA